VTTRSSALEVVDTPGPVPVLPDMAKMPAVNRLASALEDRGLLPNTAAAIAIAVCDPSQARRQLEQPTAMRVNGGTLEVIYADVWVPAVLPFPENPRMLPGLTYAVESHEGRRQPLPAARVVNDISAELVMKPVPAPELVDHLDRQFHYLRQNNDLRESVGNHGIQEPMLLVALAFEGLQNELTRGLRAPKADYDDLSTILTSVDGNSRLAAAYSHLQLDPGEMITKLLNNPRAIRQRIGGLLATQRNGEPDTAEAEEALRALAAPAAIIIGFTPTIEGRDLGDAIQSRLGALHVAPPKAWSQASKFDLLLNVSLDALQPRFDDVAAGEVYTGADYRDWLAGNLTAEEAAAVDLDPEPDLRAVALRWWFTGRRREVSSAIRRLDITGQVSPNMRANVAAEGALRSFRSGMTATEADNARRLLAALYQLDEVNGQWVTDDSAGLGSIAAARKKATAEIADTGRPGPDTRLLMLLAFYWFARYKIVPLETRGGIKDRRKLAEVMKLMCRTEHGVRVLAQTIKDGRHGVHPRAVGADGKIEIDENGKSVPLSDQWIRRTWSTGRPLDDVRSPHKDLENRSARVEQMLRDVSDAVASLSEPLAGDGLPLVESIGMETAQADRILSELDDIRDVIMELRIISKRSLQTPRGK
jgi:hypothetical protein